MSKGRSDVQSLGLITEALNDAFSSSFTMGLLVLYDTLATGHNDVLQTYVVLEPITKDQR